MKLNQLWNVFQEIHFFNIITDLKLVKDINPEFRDIEMELTSMILKLMYSLDHTGDINLYPYENQI